MSKKYKKSPKSYLSLMKEAYFTHGPNADIESYTFCVVVFSL